MRSELRGNVLPLLVSGVLFAITAAPAFAQSAAVVEGRCLAAEDHSPLEGAVVRVGSVRDLLAAPGSVASRPAPAAVVSCVSGADGRFRLEVPSTTEVRVVTVTKAGRTQRIGGWNGLAEASVLALGDIDLSAGFPVRGKVLGAGGKPVSGVRVSVPNAPVGLSTSALVPRFPTGRTDEAGEFELDVLLPAGTWSLAASGAGVALDAPELVTVHPQRGCAALTLRVVADSATGERALPFPRRRGAAADPAQTCSFELTVVEAKSGAPVEAFAVRCHPRAVRSSRGTSLRFAGRHADGRVTVDGLTREDHVLVVVPDDPALGRSRVVPIHVQEGTLPPLRIELVRLTPVAVAIHGEDGSPIAGAKCELWDPRGGVVDGKTRALDDAPVLDPALAAPKRPERVSVAISDANGRAVLHGELEVQGLCVRVLAPNQLPSIAPLELPTAGAAPQKILVRAGGTITGKVGPQAVVSRWNPRFEIRPANSPRPAYLGTDLTSLGAGGSFVMNGVAPGTWLVTPIVSVATATGRGGSRSDVRLVGCERTIEVRGSGATELAFDLSAWSPATVEGIVTEVSDPNPRGTVVLVGRNGTERWECGAFTISATGEFRAEGLLPGTYHLKWLRRAGADGTVVHPEAFEVPAGARVHQEFRFDAK